jgi:hypothetical protein
LRWITARDLEQWASAVSSRTSFPALIGDLIRASVPDISAFRFPSGDKGQVRGFDGYLVAGGTPPYVPGGESIWEFGVTKADTAKADAEFEKHVGRIPADKRASMTFVFATLQTWDNPQKRLQTWIDEQKAKNEWADVLYIDGVQLEAWLEDCPAVGARYSRYEMGLYPQSGASSTEEFWELYSTRFRPELCEDVLLCDREAQSNSLLQKLGQGPGDIIIAADSPDEVTAFAVAATRKAPADIRLFLEARTLVVETEEAARQLGSHKGRIYLPRGQARQASGLLARYGPTVIGLGRDEPRRNYEVLVRPSTQALGKAISFMDVTEDRAYQLARVCGRSVTILARILGSPGHTPEWTRYGRSLIPALLAGGWDAECDADKSVLTQLAAARPYPEIEADLLPLIRLQDPPIDREGAVWKMRAPVDAFTYLGHLIGEEDLSRLRSAALEVFSRIEPPPDPDEPFRLERRPPDAHTSWLRDGLATTLLQIAVLQEQAQLNIQGRTGQQFVEEIISSLPGLASDYRLLASLRYQLPLLAEAAPDPLLAALERLLEGDGSAIKPIFYEVDQILAPSSPHTGLLWALETLAWEPTLLARVTLVLARLAHLDPGGRLSNRPINSLREIFLPFDPNTNASLVQRLAALDQIVQRVPDVGWSLILLLLPTTHVSWMQTSKPKFREADSSNRQIVTYALIWEQQREIITRALDLAEDKADRWVEIVKAITNFEPALLTRALESLRAVLDRASREDRQLVWSALREQVNRNRAFPGAKWALPEAELKQLESLVEKFKPTDEIDHTSWLFDDWHPDIPGNEQFEDGPIKDARQQAMRNILAQYGPDGVLQLAAKVSLPQFVATTFGEVAADDLGIFQDLTVKALTRGGQLNRFSTAISGVAREKFGEQWAEAMLRLSRQHRWEPETTALLFFSWPDEAVTWSQIAKFGAEVETTYWQKKPSWIIQNLADCEEAVARYLRVGRAVAALDAIHFKLKEVKTETIFQVLDAAVAEVNADPHRVHSSFTYHVEQAFQILYARTEVPRIEVAKREYAYLPALEHKENALVLHRLLAEDPQFYVSVLCDVFRARSGDVVTPTKEVEARARAGYRLLNSLKLVPGEHDGIVDAELLRTWVRQVRQLASEADRADIGDQYVGHVLAHAPFDAGDKGWPDRAIRDVIEESSSTQIENGVATERFNMRGVHSKALYEGGKQERGLAEQYHGWARAAGAWPRTAAMLERIAQSWEADAQREDTRAEQDRLRD